MKKILSVGDLHGSNIWENINPDKYDKIIFVGDYVDSFTLSNVTIKWNLENLIKFKKKYPEKVVLLWGNHELHYLWDEGKYQCSGFRADMKPSLQSIFKENKLLFNCAYEIHTAHRKYLWTHSGVHQEWFDMYLKYDKKNKITECLKHLKGYEISEKINMLFHEKRYDPLFYIDPERSGFSKNGGPLWCGKKRMLNNPLNGYTQIFGHTASKQNKIEEYIINENKIVIVDNPEDPFYEFEIDDNFTEYF